MQAGSRVCGVQRPASGLQPRRCRKLNDSRSPVRAAGPGGEVDHSEDPLSSLQDPEAKFRRYGEHYGKEYFVQGLMDSAPQIRVRRAADRARDQLADLAVLNTRLASTHHGGSSDAEAAAVRQRVDYLRRRRRSWELVTSYVEQHDALCTLAAIEEASRKVEAALTDDARERSGVGELRAQLEELQVEVTTARERLQVTQQRVDVNLQRVNELRKEAALLERALTSASSQQQAAAPQPQQAAQQLVSARGSGQEQSKSTNTRGLHSGLELEEGLKNHWYAVHFSSRLTADMLIPFELFGEPWVLFRDSDGKAACVRDECAHRACPLSVGKVVDGQVQCAYHGWRFNSSGDCTVMPSTAFCRGVAVAALPLEEEAGLIWVWPGWRRPGPVPAAAVTPPAGYALHAEIEVEVPVEHGLLLENLLDLAHAPFTHTSTFARGWPVPDIVQFQAARLLGGNWQPYPIHMEFAPPCMVLSTIGLAQPGKIQRGVEAADCANHLHQLHICLPSRRGHTRLLYRMSLDFLGWTRFVPGIQQFWKSIAGQVLGEDLVLVEGQQQRMQQGGNTWAFPVSYDKLAVRYRRWRNTVAVGATADGSDDVVEPPPAPDAEGDGCLSVLKMSAGEVFAMDDDAQCSIE